VVLVSTARRYGLDGIAEALDYLEEAHADGKIAIEVGP